MSEENQFHILNILIEYFNENGWPVDVNEEKLLGRSTVHTENSEPNIKVIKIERHRAILGDQHKKGLPMSSYQTYWMNYSINEITNEIVDLGEQIGKCDIDLLGLVSNHLEACFSLSLEPIDDGLYLIQDYTSNLTREITSVEGICDCIFEEIPGFVEFFRDSIDLEESLDQIQKDKYISDYECELRKQLIEKANRLWEDRE